MLHIEVVGSHQLRRICPDQIPFSVAPKLATVFVFHVSVALMLRFPGAILLLNVAHQQRLGLDLTVGSGLTLTVSKILGEKIYTRSSLWYVRLLFCCKIMMIFYI